MIKNIVNFREKNLVVFNLVFTYLWLVLLKDTEAYYSIYILCGLISLSNMIITRNKCLKNTKCNISITSAVKTRIFNSHIFLCTQVFRVQTSKLLFSVHFAALP